MRSRYEAYMDGTALSSVHPKLIITDISHSVSPISVIAKSIANRNGMVVTSRKRANTSVSISFMLRIYDISERQKVMQEVQRWASGSVLEVNDRPGQILYAHCDTMPAISSAQQWTDTVTMTFVSYEMPFWMEKYASEFTATGTSGSGNLFVPGNAGEVVLEALITPASSISSASITVRGRTISLTGLSATSSLPVSIWYDDRGIQHIDCGTTSILSKRTGADDLLAECGKYNSISFSASASVTLTVKARGCWL